MFGFFKSREKLPDTWSTAQGEDEGSPLLIRVREGNPSDKLKAEYPILVNVYWPFDGLPDSGMPNSEVLDAQSDFEERLDRLDSPEYGYLVLVITAKNRKEWIWQVADTKVWLDQFNLLLNGHPVVPIEIETNNDPAWGTYEQIRDRALGA